MRIKASWSSLCDHPQSEPGKTNKSLPECLHRKRKNGCSFHGGQRICLFPSRRCSFSCTTKRFYHNANIENDTGYPRYVLYLGQSHVLGRPTFHTVGCEQRQDKAETQAERAHTGAAGRSRGRLYVGRNIIRNEHDQQQCSRCHLAVDQAVMYTSR